MSNMLEALKNTHYKKIWEKVIMNRHPEAESLNLALGSEYLQYEEECITITDIIIKEILGRPITLEDISMLLPNYSTYLIKRENSLLKLKIFEIIDDKKDVLKCKFDCKFDWQLTKFLHEQTPETWEKIANLI